MTAQTTDLTVRKSITVAVGQAKAFAVFTTGIDAWWPRGHHLKESSPMKEQVFEGRVGGRCFERCEDGSECDWARVLAWEPPSRVVIAWHLNPEWVYVADSAQASEVEVRFTADGPDRTRVELEHRHFERHGAGAEAMSKGVGSPDGWNGLLTLYGKVAEA